jgi:hypothetical protein
MVHGEKTNLLISALFRLSLANVTLQMKYVKEPTNRTLMRSG